MFEKLVDDINNQTEEAKDISIDLAKSPAINRNFFKDQMEYIDTIRDRDLYNLVKEAHRSILEGIMTKNDTSYIDAFTNPRFLSALIQVLGNVTLDHEERICCNKLAYDYFTLKNNDSYIKQLFYNLSKIVNRDKIPSLLSIGVPENLAIHLALARYSSNKESINVKRVNFIITTSPKEVMTEQNIVYIYERLFDNFTPIFTATMTDVYNDEEEWVTDDIMEVYSTVSLAVLLILNNMTSDKIRKVLISYTGDYNALYSNRPNSKRFSLRSLSADYSRITSVVEALQEEGVYVP